MPLRAQECEELQTRTGAVVVAVVAALSPLRWVSDPFLLEAAAEEAGAGVAEAGGKSLRHWIPGEEAAAAAAVVVVVVELRGMPCPPAQKAESHHWHRSG